MTMTHHQYFPKNPVVCTITWGKGAAAIRVCLARALPDRPLDDDIVPTGRIRDGGGSDAVIFHDAALNHSSDFLRSERYLG